MTPKNAFLASFILAGGFLATSAHGQVVIVPVDPVKQQEQLNTKLVNGWMKAYLNRKATDKEFNVLMQQLRMGATPIAAQVNILSSDEYFKKHGSTPQGFVQGLFVDVLGRKATPGEMLQLIPQANGLGRAKFAAEFLTLAQPPMMNGTVTAPPTIIIIQQKK